MHDPTLARTCGSPEAVADLSWDEVCARDAGAGFTAADGSHPFRGRGIHPPALYQVLRAFPDMPILIELKAAEAQDEVAEVLLEERAIERCVLALFEDRALRAFREPPYQVGASRRDILGLYVRARLGLRVKPKCLCYAVPDRWKGRVEIPRVEVVAAAREAGVPVHVWTVDDPDRALELWGRGVSGIITNRLGGIRGALA
jgi:glycerophosphoryl diester phosphodiesterase